MAPTCSGRRYEARLRRAPGDAHDDEDARDLELVRAAAAAERQRLIDLRASGTIGDAAFQQVEQELDLRELDLGALTAQDSDAREAVTSRKE